MSVCVYIEESTIGEVKGGFRGWFSRVVFEVVLGTGFRFICIGNQSSVFALDFTLVFGTRSRTLNTQTQVHPELELLWRVKQDTPGEGSVLFSGALFVEASVVSE